MTSLDRDVVKKMDCEMKSCGKQIGMDDYVLCQDGVTQKQVVFHKKCFDEAAVTDVRKHHGVHLNPGHLGLVGMSLGGKQ